MELWMIRHAATEWNKQKRFQGSRDIPLSSEGRTEAGKWKIQTPEKVYVSPLMRAKETAQLVFPNTEIEVYPQLRELAVGKWEGQTLEQIGSEALDWAGLDFAPVGGESLRQVMERCLDWLRSIPENDSVCAVVTHKMTIHAFYALATGWTAEGKPQERLKFPRIHKFRYENGELSIVKLNEPLEGANDLS